jgi:hypothetical protein
VRADQVKDERAKSGRRSFGFIMRQKIGYLGESSLTVVRRPLCQSNRPNIEEIDDRVQESRLIAESNYGKRMREARCPRPARQSGKNDIYLELRQR